MRNPRVLFIKFGGEEERAPTRRARKQNALYARLQKSAFARFPRRKRRRYYLPTKNVNTLEKAQNRQVSARGEGKWPTRDFSIDHCRFCEHSTSTRSKNAQF